MDRRINPILTDASNSVPKLCGWLCNSVHEEFGQINGHCVHLDSLHFHSRMGQEMLGLLSCGGSSYVVIDKGTPKECMCLEDHREHS